MPAVKDFRKKIFVDAFAVLMGSNVLANFMTYHIATYENYTFVFWVFFTILLVSFLGGLILLRKQNLQKRNVWDLVFPVFLLALMGLLVGVALSLGDIYDKDFGAKVLDKIDSDFTRTMIDIYASGANETLIFKPVGLIIVLFATVLSRFLGAISKKIC